MREKVLIIDDEQGICESLTFALASQYEVHACTDPERGIDSLRDGNFDVVLLDQRLGKYNGMNILREIRGADLRAAVIMMTAYGSEKASVEAMKLGAYSYLTKPLDIEELRLIISKAMNYVKITDDVHYLSGELKEKSSKVQLVGHSPQIVRILKLIDKIKDVDSTVLITGESGTGKEVVARKIHESGKRANERFVVLNCAAIPEALLESELFGHKKGAFTGAANDQKGKFLIADKGTIFLDEIGDMPLYLQAKILRVLQEKIVVPVGGHQEEKVDVRVIAATNRNLRDMVKEGTFREDLFYRLNVIGIQIPPLRERTEDIMPLCTYFIEKYNSELKKSIKGLTESAQKRMLSYDYPGNVRQLANMIERAVILTSGDMISPLTLPEGNEDREEPNEEALQHLLAGKNMKEIEHIAIIATLRSCNGKKADAAEMLGISERTLWNKIREYHIG